MKLTYILNARLPTEKAHGVQISKMCEAFAALGAEVSLIIPKRKNPIQTDFFSYYEVKQDFSVRYVSCPDLLTRFSRWSRLGFYGQALSFLWGLRTVPVSKETVVITRNPEIAWWYAKRGYTVFFDAHNFPVKHKKIFLFLLRNVAGIIANSQGTMAAFKREGCSSLIAVPNGVDLKQFANVKLSERVELGLPTGHIAMYIGHLYGWKGVDTIVQAARKATTKDLTFVLVGGTEKDLERYRLETGTLKHIIFLGHRMRQEIPPLMAQADVLLLPNIPTTQESIVYTSPIKMFEYMASGVPIVASDLPSIREILHEDNAILMAPGDPEALLQGIEQALKPEARARALRAQEEVKEYTWDRRAQKILTFISEYVRNHR